MSLLCKHKWAKIKETSAPPTTGKELSTNITSVIEKMLFGVVTILWECEKCGEIRKVEMLGKEV